MFPRAQRLEGHPTLVVRGELDICGAIALEAELTLVESARPILIVLDLRELSFIDLHGLDAILAAHDRAEEDRRQVACIVGANDVVRRLFELAGVGQELKIIEEPDHDHGTDDQAPASGAA
jgi:anti-anti-sigma factor